MIKPHKYLNLDKSVINISALIIEQLKINSKIEYNLLLKTISTKLGDSINDSFLYSINLLFLLGVIIYNKETDTLELIK